MTLPPRPLALYEQMPLPTLSESQLEAIADQHGLHLDQPITPMVSTGVVHSLWSIGTRWVLRVPKNETMSLGDHRCEAVAIPLALQAGVRTPALVAFDDSLSILDVPYSVVERVDGTDLAGESFGHDAYEQLGCELAKLHSADLTAHHHKWLRDTGDLPAEAHFDDVLDAGLLNQDAVSWLRRLCDDLDSIIDSGPQPFVTFIHNDVKPDNVMLDKSGQTQLIDWGDAGFGDAAHDFEALPMRATDNALRGYRTVRDDDPTLEARIIRRVVARSLSNLRRTPLEGPSWYRPIATNLTDMLTFAIDEPNRWHTWTKRQ